MSDAPSGPWSAAHDPVSEPVEPEVAVHDGHETEVVEQVEQMPAEDTAVETEPEPATLDLDLVERDLADVELALARLDAGTYWTDEVTGASIADELLAERPTARRAAAH